MIPGLGSPGEPTPSQLRWFGLLLAAFLTLLGVFARWKWDAPTAAWVAWGLASVFGPLYYAVPSLRRPMLVAWRRSFAPLEHVISLLALGAVYYGVVTPLGLLLRLSRRDTMGRRFDPDAPSYFVDRKPAGDPPRYFQQF
jgi:hypothetical protein